jgi:outer membrane protein assembly factor BamB
MALVFFSLAVPIPADDWPQWRGPDGAGAWQEDGILDRFPAGGPRVLWRTPVGPGFSGPVVSDGRLYVMDRVVDTSGASDVKIRWNHRDKTSGRERVVCLDATGGKVLWTHAYACDYDVAYGIGPRSTPTVHGDAVYVLGAMGDLLCLESATGRLLWRIHLVKDLGAEVPFYGYSAAPLVSGDHLIVMVGGKGRTVVAFDRATGKVAWKALDASEPGYCMPRILTLAGRRQLFVWHADGLSGLDPASGDVFWAVPHPVRHGIAISPPAVSGNRIVVSSQYEGAIALEFKEASPVPTVLWKASTGAVPERRGWKKKGLNTTMSTVVLRDNHVYGVSLYGETCCLDGETGNRVWTTLQPTSGGDVPRDRWFTVFMVRHRDRDFLFTERGDLIIARLKPAGYEEIDRTHLVDPDMPASGGSSRKVIWTHPAYANRCIYVRSNAGILCASMAATP